MVDLTGKIWKLYEEKINTDDIRVGDMIDNRSKEMGVVYCTEKMVRVAFPCTKEKIWDVWFVAPYVGELRVGAYGDITEEDNHYELAREFLAEAESPCPKSR